MARLSLLLIIGLICSCTVDSKQQEHSIGVLIKSSYAYKHALVNGTTFAIELLNSKYNVSHSIRYQEYDSSMLGSSSLTTAICSLANASVVSIITVSSSDDTAFQADLLQELHLPLIAVSATNPYLKQEDRDYLLLLSSNDRYASEAIFNLLKLYNWVEFSILASADDYGINGLIYLQRLAFAEKGFDIKNVQYFTPQDEISKTTNYFKELQTIKASMSQIIILHCDARYAKVIFETAHKLDMMSSGYVWIVTDGIAEQPELLSYEGSFPSYYDGLIGLYPSFKKGTEYNTLIDKYIFEKGGSRDDLTLHTLLAYDSVNLIYEALEGRSVNVSGISCTPPTLWTDGQGMLEALTGVSLNGVSGEINFTEDGIRKEISYDIVNFKETRFDNVGSWTNSNGLDINYPIRFLGGKNDTPSAFSNTLHGLALRVGLIHEPPLAYRNTTKKCVSNSSSPDCWYGVSPSIFEILSKYLNFTYEIVEPEDGTYGGINVDTKSWTGMIGDVLRGKVDLIGMPLAVTIERDKVIDFLFPIVDVPSIAIYRTNSSETSVDLFLWRTPVSDGVWMSMVMTVLVLALFTTCLHRISPFGEQTNMYHAQSFCKCVKCKQKITQSPKPEEPDCLVEKLQEDTATELEDSIKTTVYQSYWNLTFGWVGHGGDTLSSGIAVRSITVAWWFFVMIFVCMYTASLSASLTIQRVDNDITNIVDLLDQTGSDKYSWGLIQYGNMESRFLTHINPKFVEIAEKAEKLQSLDEAVARVREGKFVFIDEYQVILWYFRNECDTVKLTNSIASGELGLAVPINAPYKTLLSDQIVRLREQEVQLYAVLGKWYTGDTTCEASTFNSNEQISMDTFAGTYVYLAGVAMSCILISIPIEICYVAVSDMRSGEVSFWTALKRRCLTSFRRLFNIPLNREQI